MLQKTTIEYFDGDVKFKGYYVFDDSISARRPAVIVAHDWSGCNEFAKTKAEELAELGYVGFALDMYGNGELGDSKEEKMALMQPLMNNRMLLARRVNLALEAVKLLDTVDEERIAAIGYCFGGLCVLDLARSGAALAGVVSFHGLLMPPSSHYSDKVHAKILVLHGHDDPMVLVDQVNAFEVEMTARHVDWQLNVYSNTMHAFTNPMANDPGFGTVYNPIADKRSWAAMKNFLLEIFKLS